MVPAYAMPVALIEAIDHGEARMQASDVTITATGTLLPMLRS